MFKSIPNTNQKINFLTKEIIDGGFIYNYNGTAIKLKLKNNKEIIKEIDWIKHLINLNIIVEDKFLNTLEFLIFKKIKPHGVSKEYGYVPLFSKPQVITIEDDEYRLIARFPQYCINQYGRIFNCAKDINFEIPLLHLQHEYNRVAIPDTLGKTKFIGIQRLVGMTWVDNDDYYLKNIIDHDDKNKKNNFYKNLSWVSSTVNTARERLNYGVDRYVVKELGNDIVSYCDTLYEVSAIIGRSKMDLSSAILRFGKVWTGENGKFEIHENTKDLKWFFISKSNIDKYYLVIKNGLRYYFNKKHKLYNFLKLNEKNIDFYKMVDYVNNNVENTNVYYSLVPRNKVLREIKNIETKEIFYAINWREIQKITGNNKHNIVKFLHMNIDNRLLMGKWLIRYKSNKPWADDENRIIILEERNKKVVLTDEYGNIKFEYPSVNNATLEIKTSNRTIVKKILLNRKIEKDGLLYYIKYK